MDAVLEIVGPGSAAFQPNAAAASRMKSRTTDAVIVPLMVMAFCHDETGPSVTGTGATWVPASGAAQPALF